MREHPKITRSTLISLLDYNPTTGAFYWRVDRRPRIKAGDEAGMFRDDGYYVITVEGTTYMAHHLAWLFVTGEWPPKDMVPVFKDTDRMNTAFANLGFEPRVYSTTRAARHARRKRKLIEAADKRRNERPESTIPDIVYAPLSATWEVHLPGTPPNAIAYRHKDYNTASGWYFNRLRDIAKVRDNPPPHPRESDLTTYAGSDRSAISLAEARAWLFYEAETGRFLYRRRVSRSLKEPDDAHNAGAEGARADERNTAGTLVVKLFGRDYPAHMLAVFIETGVWPKRRSVLHRNKTRSDNSWANIEVSAAP